jgi:ketosteroid isomerase-like protein
MACMENSNENIIHQFYTAFQQCDYVGMQNLYHNDAEFHDPVFQKLNSDEVKGMWQMLLSSAKDLSVSYSNVQVDGDSGTCRWEAVYTFSQTRRKVHNKIYATFEFKDGKIVRHRDTFNLWRWTRMALGLPGVLLGWTPSIQNKIRNTAQDKLKKFMATPVK